MQDWQYTSSPTPNSSADTPDSDGDGLTDQEELTGSLNPYGEPTDRHNADSDGDGLSDYAECITHGTNPNIWATDGDIFPWPPPSGAVSDWWGSDSYEIANGWNPLVFDENASGIPDSWEMAFPGTNLYADADGDGISNYDELAQNSDPNDINSTTAQPYVIRYESSMPGWENDGMTDIGLEGWVKTYFEGIKADMDLCVWVKEGRTQEEFRVVWRGATQKGIHWLSDQEVVTSASAGADTRPYLFVQDLGMHPDYTNTLGGEYKMAIIKIDLITPAGDPVAAPVDSGDGQNEFTYSTASAGVLTMNLKAHVTPSGIANQIKDQCLFTVDTIAGSTLAWDAANPGGKPTASGDDLLATVTFTGLPANNTAFGSKKAAVYFNACKQDEKSYEVFYPRDAANHPGGQSGSPNWFHYWSQAISANNITYTAGSSLYGECPGMLHWSYSTSQNKDVVIVYDTAATEDPGDANADHGKRATTGIDTFEDTYLHEHYHTVQIDQADNVVGIVPNTPWRYGWSWNQSSHNHWSKGADGQPGVAGTDDDTNGTIDDLIVSGPGELGNGDDVLLDSGYDWPQAFGSLPSTPWAGGGPIEDQAYNQEPDNENARASVDWGNPGKQHQTLNKYDD